MFLFQVHLQNLSLKTTILWCWGGIQNVPQMPKLIQTQTVTLIALSSRCWNQGFSFLCSRSALKEIWKCCKVHLFCTLDVSSEVRRQHAVPRAHSLCLLLITSLCSLLPSPGQHLLSNFGRKAMCTIIQQDACIRNNNFWKATF